METGEFLNNLLGEKMSYGMHLRAYRTRLGLSQQQLADMLGTSKQYINNLENRKKAVSLKRALEFAEIMEEPKELVIELVTHDNLERLGYEGYQVRVSC